QLNPLLRRYTSSLFGLRRPGIPTLLPYTTLLRSPGRRHRPRWIWQSVIAYRPNQIRRTGQRDRLIRPRIDTRRLVARTRRIDRNADVAPGLTPATIDRQPQPTAPR